MDLAGRARVPRNEKAVLKALVQFADWKTGKGIRANVETIGASAGYARRQTGILLDKLDARGLIVFVYKSKGGNGRPHIININVHQLRLLATEECSGDDCDEVTSEPRIQQQPTAHSATINRALRAQDQETTMRTTNRPPAARIAERREEPNVKEGGGGMELDDQEQAERMLLEQGVRTSNASKLSRAFSPKLVRSAIELVKSMPRLPRSHPGMVVHLLTSGEAQERLNEAALKEQRIQERKRQVNRRNKCRALDANLQIFKGAPEGPQVGEMLRVVHAVWPTVGQITERATLSDEEWNLAETDPLRLLRLLAQAAAECAERRSTSQEPRRSMAAHSGVVS
ncbi:MAG: hypothetical protein HND58_04680 [Planctomycetota bacterium]|nr:MAG: hypothetical protein HND58_04680 [Planctomycetota bacterium]